MDNYKRDNLEIVASDEDGVITLRWLGTSDARNAAIDLEPYLYTLLERIPTFQTCEFNFSELEFMSSSTVATIVHLIEKMRLHSARFTLVFSEQEESQDFNFRMMKFITRHVDNITVLKK